jgi:hypothetical protein
MSDFQKLDPERKNKSKIQRANRAMKSVKFRDYLVPLVLSGEKTSTWRLFDDKDLSVGDIIELRIFGSQDMFGQAEITKVIEKPFADLTELDLEGHEKFDTLEQMYATYEQYYRVPVGPETVVKIIWFYLAK